MKMSSCADGLILVCEDPAWVENAVERSQPAVIAGCRPLTANRAAVYCDPRKIGELAAQHLRQSGHNYLACLCHEGDLAQGLRHGFVEQARRHEIEPAVHFLPAPTKRFATATNRQSPPGW